jgi:hypothetical protein
VHLQGLLPNFEVLKAGYVLETAGFFHATESWKEAKVAAKNKLLKQ